MSTVR